MRSLAVWLFIGIVVLGAFGVDSRTNRGYHVIHGQAGPIIRSIVPTIGYSNVGPQIIRRRQNRQDPDEDEDEEDEDEEEEDEVYGPFGEQFGEQDSYGYGIDGEEGDEDEDEDEEDGEGEGEDEGDGEYDENDDDQGPSYNEVEGRQAYINNQYIDRPTFPSSPRQKPHTSRVPVRNTNTRKPVPSKTNNNKHVRPTKPTSRKPNNKPTKVRPSPHTPHTQQATVVTNEEVEVQKVETEPTTPTTTTTTHTATSPHTVHKEKIQLRPVATSTQFIATPVADLILRLSISIAKPVGQGHANTTSYNVPIRIHHTAVPAVESDVTNGESARTVEVVAKTETTKIATTENHDQANVDVDESDEDVDTVAVTVTELPRK